MLRRQLAVRIFALAALIYGLNCAFNQYAFQSFIDDLQIKFDDFPTEYVQALNSSVAHGQQPSEFDYTSAYPETKIPRTLHYIFFENLYPTHEGPKAVPLSGTRSPTLCRRHNPDYEIRIWNATSAREFFTKEYPWFLPTYDGYHYPIQRIDALKYFVLYHYGGVYLDLDVACRRSLDPLLAFPAWFPKASPLGVNNDLMASAARHPLLEKMTKGLVTHDWNLLFPYLTIFWTTGPRFTSDIIQEWYNNCDAEKCGKRSSNKDLESDDFVILPPMFYSEEYTFFGHIAGGTWYGPDVAVVLWCIERPWASLIILAAVIGTVAGIQKGFRMAQRKEKTYEHLV